MFRVSTPTFSLFDVIKDIERTERCLFESGKQFPTDVLDVGDAYRIDIELPGFAKEEIKVSLEGKNLTVTAKHEPKEESDEAKPRYLSRQRSEKSFSRTYLVNNVEKSGIAVKLENGVLSVTLPKVKPIEPEVTEFPVA